MLTPRAAADPFPSLPFPSLLTWLDLQGVRVPVSILSWSASLIPTNPISKSQSFLYSIIISRTHSRTIYLFTHILFGSQNRAQKKKRINQSLSTATMEDLPPGYRPNVGVCLINSDNLIFVGSRLNVPGAWQMPQGGIEDGEEPKSAAIRELREETGIESAEIIDEVPNWLTYDFPPAVKTKVNRLWGGEWHGQAQKWFLMRFTKDESEINLATGEADPEFAEWKWASPEEVIEQAVDYKRPTYEEVMKTFKSYLDGSALSAKCKSTKW